MEIVRSTKLVDMRLRAINEETTSEDLAALDAALGPKQMRQARVQLAGDDLTPFVILRGWACLTRTAADGGRQIMSFLLPGDAVGFGPATKSLAGDSLWTLTPLTFRRLRSDRARYLMSRTALMRAFSGLDARHQNYQRNQILRLSRLSALRRMADLLAELAERMTEVSPPGENGVAMPLRQVHCSDALGMSVVHVRHVLKELAARGATVVENDRLLVCDIPLLQALARDGDRRAPAEPARRAPAQVEPAAAATSAA
ncbi:MAG: Crp/Fnr family transcriptional regulator [Phenylobacterium sp.]|uniref:Crp/Fnr family transcriptional regulator n=1 Tax=Phenylobacterium sp. TaxID=1871053 RepID=UPI00391CEF51